MNADNLHKTAPMILAGLFLFGALMDAICAFIFYIKTKKKYENYLQTEGVISGIIKKKNSKGSELIYPILKFSIGSKGYETENGYGKAPWNIEQGQQVTIIYNQENPNEAEIENKLMQYLLPIIFTTGAFFALIGSVVVYIGMSK